MKPAPFDYHRAEDVQHAVQLLGQLGPDAKLLAGGQSLVPLMNFRLARPSALIDLNHVPGLAYIRRDGGRLRLGALARHAQVEGAPAAAEACPILAEAMKQVGHAAIRARGTVGGSIAHADPAAELPLLAVVFDGQVAVQAETGQRTIDARDFFVDALLTALEPHEMVVEVSLDSSRPWTGSAFLELSRRHGDFAIVSAAVLIEEREGRCRDVRIAIGGANPVPFRATLAEGSLREQKPTGADLREAAALAAQRCDPPSDVHGSSDYRRQLVRVLVYRALNQALGRDYRRAEAAA
ncbi:MAG: xanthine dehydrogenase family protein subunit M [Chloroflexota bacterium]|nr:xanthine dehydrogenase family protein subunit M [Chloroflexota bacterium]